jgi:NDP-sugar pyrophosphorylase family protein
VASRGYQDIKETLLPRLHQAGERVDVYVIADAEVPRVTGTQTYLAVATWAVTGVQDVGSLPPGYTRRGDSWVHETARISPTARLVGPTLIGPGSVVEANAMVIGPTTVGRGCLIARDAVVSRSVIWDGCAVGAGAMVDQCILTDSASVEAELVVRTTVCFARRRTVPSMLGRVVSSLGANGG